MKRIIFLGLLAAAPFKAEALELLLEENRGDSGTIGYVDIDRVFKDYSGTTGAREEFMAEIKRKEDALNAKKAVIFSLKAEIAKLRQEREFALTLPSLLETQRSVTEAEAATKAALAAARAAAEAAVQASTAAVTVSTAAPAVSSGTAAGADKAPQPAPPGPEPALQPAAIDPLLQALPGMGGIDMPGVAKVPVAHFKFSISTSVPEIDTAIERKGTELAAREDELRQSQRQAERELLEYESRKGELLLGRIYTALKELAVKEEVSVIVDKRNILFGQTAVDLTGKLLKKLEENSI